MQYCPDFQGSKCLFKTKDPVAYWLAGEHDQKLSVNLRTATQLRPSTDRTVHERSCRHMTWMCFDSCGDD